jgi:hypothetical protein
MRSRPASLSAERRRSPSGMLRASAMTSVARSSQTRLSGCCCECAPRPLPNECIVLDHYLVKVFALGALKRAEVETQTCGHDAREHHMSMAIWASWTLDVEVDLVGQERMRFWHDASLNKAGAQHSQSPECAC